MSRNSQKKDRHEPSGKEICQKITQAINALQANRYLFIDERHRSLGYEFLDISTEEELLDWLAALLQEINDIGPKVCFVGKYAQRCYHKGFKDIFLFAYSWESTLLGKKAYLKFGIRKTPTSNGKEIYYCHLDCHEDEPHKA